METIRRRGEEAHQKAIHGALIDCIFERAVWNIAHVADIHSLKKEEEDGETQSHACGTHLVAL